MCRVCVCRVVCRVTIRLDSVEERDGGLVARINFSQSPIAVR